MESLHYRPEIDGLRALAVLGVMAYHAGMPWFSGGFLGVDVFFVISGYLITRLILTDLAQQQFSIKRFYLRRARRILPALLLVLLSCIPLAWFLLLPSELTDFAEQLLSVQAFMGNFWFWLDSDYFSPDSELFLLIHTWSLAVEEQFYLFFPLLLMFTYRHIQILIAIVAVAILGSFALSVWYGPDAPETNFFLLPTRFWELAIGSACALYLTHRPNIRSHTTLLCSIGLVMITAAYFLVSTNQLHPGWVTLAPVLGTGLIILCSPINNPIFSLLSWQPIRWLGLWSYSAYLWHQPLFAGYRIHALAEVSWLELMPMFALTWLLAAMTWRWVEQPCRNSNTLTNRSFLTSVMIVTLLLIAIALIILIFQGFPARLL